MSTHEPSPFAADFQCCRIDVYNPGEVRMYNKYLEILKHSRRNQFQMIRTETQRDYQSGLTRSAHLPIKTSTWDFQNFFAGFFYIGIPRAVYNENIESVRQQMTAMGDVDWDKFTEQQQDFEVACCQETQDGRIWRQRQKRGTRCGSPVPMELTSLPTIHCECMPGE